MSPFSAKDMHDLIKLLEERPEWKKELRRLILTEELLDLPKAFQGIVEVQKHTDEKLDILTNRIDQLAEIQKRTEEQLKSLTQIVNQLTEAQQKTEERVRTFLMDVSELKEDALERGIITRDQTEDLLQLDLLLKGKRWDTKKESYLAVEISWGLGKADVDRMERRVQLLRHIGLSEVIGAIAGKKILYDVEEYAVKRGIKVVLDGKVIHW